MASTKKEVAALDPTVRPSQSAAAKAILDNLRGLREQIPGFVAAPAGRQAAVVTRAAMPSSFLEAAAVAAESSDQLRTAGSLDPDDLRETIAFAAAFEAVADEAEAFARSMRYTIAVRRSKAAEDALQTYGIAKSLVRKPEAAALVPHVGEMKKSLGRGGARKATAVAKQA